MSFDRKVQTSYMMEAIASFCYNFKSSRRRFEQIASMYSYFYLSYPRYMTCFSEDMASLSCELRPFFQSDRFTKACRDQHCCSGSSSLNRISLRALKYSSLAFRFISIMYFLLLFYSSLISCQFKQIQTIISIISQPKPPKSFLLYLLQKNPKPHLVQVHTLIMALTGLLYYFEYIIQSMKDEPIDLDPEFQPKKTRKRKATPPVVTVRNTRRAHKNQSEDECPLPQVIPLSEHSDLMLFQSFDLEVTRLVLQVPVTVFAIEGYKQSVDTRVQTKPIDIQIQLDSGNLICQLRTPGQDEDSEPILIVHGKYSWFSDTEVTTKVIKSSRRALKGSTFAEVVRFKAEPKSDVFIVLSLRWEEQDCRDFNGLVNQGNTCYMNSYLQMLFHLAEFRKLLFAAEVKEKDKFPATLQLLFYRMLSEEKPVSPEDLVRSFGWSKKEVQIQQDAQEFSCLFFDALQRTIEHRGGKWGSVPDLFCGELVHYIQCCNTDFRTQNRERFYDLQLPLANTLAAALDDYVGEQALEGENSYWTDIYGVQQAKKGLRLSYLPPVLMLQLKRFQFNPYTEANEKILDRCAYPQKMEFSKWTLDPSTQKLYELYAVLVHEGSQASSGHYYVYIRLDQQWYRFNDQRVEYVEKARALDYNFGGQSEIVEYDAKQMKVNQKQIPNKSTAYLLVYISKDCKNQLTEQQKSILPQWLIQHTKQKCSLDEEKKLRKQSICDISILHWDKSFKGKECAGSGLNVREEQETLSEKIEMIPKNQKMQEWIQTIQKNPEESLSLLWNSLEREVLVNVRSRTYTIVSELFKDVTDPILFYAPIKYEKDEFLVIVKIFNTLAEPSFVFHSCLKIKKESSRGELYSLLEASVLDGISANYYIQDKKNGLSKLELADNTLLPAPSPSKNQLLIAVVEISNDQDTSGVSQLYKDEMDSIAVTVKGQDKRQFQYELSKHMTVKQLREFVFGELQKEYQWLKNPENIMFKYKAKKNSKITTEAHDQDLLEDILRADKVVHLCHSSLNASERHLLREINVHCRNKAYQLSQPIKLVIERSQEDKLLQIAQKNEKIVAILPKEEGKVYKAFLLGRDRSFITDIVQDNGRITGKGDLASALSRDKNSILVLELEAPETRPPEETIPVLVHHATKTGQRFSNPRIFIVSRSETLLALRNFLLEAIQADTYQFQGKSYNFNPFKLRFFVYTKDINKGFDLPQPKEMIVQQGQEVKNDQKDPTPCQTINDRFSKNRNIRVAVIHNYIAKGTQMLKLNVE